MRNTTGFGFKSKNSQKNALIAAEIQLCTKQDTVDRRELLHRYLSELADVDIVLEQVKFLLSPSMRSYFYDVREDKIIRTLKRIEAEKR